MSLDKNFTTRITIERDYDSKNDICTIQTVNHQPYETFQRADIEISPISFTGIVQQVTEKEKVFTTIIASPSILLTRNECDISFSEETTVDDILNKLLPASFSLETDDNSVYSQVYKDENSIGKTKYNVIEDMLTSLGYSFKFNDWTMIIQKYQEGDIFYDYTTSPSVYVLNKEFEKSSGSYNIYSKLKAYHFREDETETLEYELFPDAENEIVDITTFNENQSQSEMVATVEKKAIDFLRAFSKRTYRLGMLFNVKPGKQISIYAGDYDLLKVKYDISKDESTTELTVSDHITYSDLNQVH